MAYAGTEYLMSDEMRLYLTEIMGTFFLVFIATGAVVVNDVSGGLVTHVGISITTGLGVMAIIYAIGDISGAHINPAVTLGFWLSGRFPGTRVAPYIVSQCLGGIAASLLLYAMFPAHPHLAATIPGEPLYVSFVFEIVITMFLMFVILSVATGSKEKGIMAGSAIGAVVGLAVLFAGPVSGASMNPARSLAPAVVTLNFAGLSIIEQSIRK